MLTPHQVIQMYEDYLAYENPKKPYPNQWAEELVRKNNQNYYTLITPEWQWEGTRMLLSQHPEDSTWVVTVLDLEHQIPGVVENKVCDTYEKAYAFFESQIKLIDEYFDRIYNSNVIPRDQLEVAHKLAKANRHKWAEFSLDEFGSNPTPVSIHDYVLRNSSPRDHEVTAPHYVGGSELCHTLPSDVNWAIQTNGDVTLNVTPPSYSIPIAGASIVNGVVQEIYIFDQGSTYKSDILALVDVMRALDPEALTRAAIQSALQQALPDDGHYSMKIPSA
jgi:hypothetical protein